jgi:hypothetical protein
MNLAKLEKEVRYLDGNKRNHNQQTRVTKEEKERLLNLASLAGFASTSQYLRFMGLHRNLVMDKKIVENNVAINEIKKTLKKQTKILNRLMTSII